MTLFMETTEITPDKTIHEIEAVLVRYKAQAILKEYGPEGEIAAVAFRYRTSEGDIPFRLPCRWPAIAEYLRLRAKVSDYDWKSSYESSRKRRASIETKARRVAWRQVLRWIEAQLAFVDSGMVEVQEVFMSYAQISATQTMYEAIKEKGGLLQLSFKGDKNADQKS